LLPENSGRIVRQTGPDTSDVVVSEVPYPVNISFDADGQLIIGGPAFGSDGGAGQGFLAGGLELQARRRPGLSAGCRGGAMGLLGGRQLRRRRQVTFEDQALDAIRQLCGELLH